MKRMTKQWLGAAVIAIGVVACGSDTGSVGGDVATDAPILADTADTSAPDAKPADSVTSDAADIDAIACEPTPSNAFCFAPLRKLSTKTITCSTGSPPPGFPNSGEFKDTDHVCTFAHAATTGWLYVQATASDCNVTMGATASKFDVKAWFSAAGKGKEALAKADYDWGGNHHNDAILFDLGGKHYKAWHSSIGFGWRACQPPDCLQVLDDTGAIVEDGCTKNRTLPIACQVVADEGTITELKDTFVPCKGDPNYP